MEALELKNELEGIKNDLAKKQADEIAAIKAENEKVLAANKAEIESLKAASVKRDEADKLNQEALDKLIARNKDIEIEGKKSQSFNDVFVKTMEDHTDDLAKIARKEKKNLVIELKAVGDVSTANVTGTLWGSISRPGIIEQPKRKVHIRSLLPGGPIGPGTTYTFMRDAGGEGDPTPVSEGGLKPQMDVDLVEASVNIETIAGWLRVSRKAMNNIPGFIAYLQSRLPERLLKVEDAQILYGNGSTPNLKGILTSGNHVASTSTAPVLVEAIIDDISLLEDTYEREATGIAMRPSDYYSFFKNKAAGSGEYDLPQGVSFVNGVLYILGIPVAPTTALTAGDYVVGDFQSGAQLLTQEGMRIEFFEQDGDNVQYNKVTVRIEETVALPVYGSDYFIKGTVPSAE